MAVKVITDSTSDIDHQLAQQLDVTVVPVYVRFGDKVYRDGVDLTSREFFEKLTTTPVHPATSQPPPEDFAQAYAQFRKSVDGIVSIHISSKISGTFNSAMLAARAMEPPCPIEVVDSKFNSVGLALVVMAAARSAQAGNSVEDVISAARKAIRQVRMFGMFGVGIDQNHFIDDILQSIGELDGGQAVAAYDYIINVFSGFIEQAEIGISRTSRKYPENIIAGFDDIITVRNYCLALFYTGNKKKGVFPDIFSDIA